MHQRILYRLHASQVAIMEAIRLTFYSYPTERIIFWTWHRLQQPRFQRRVYKRAKSTLSACTRSMRKGAALQSTWPYTASMNLWGSRPWLNPEAVILFSRRPSVLWSACVVPCFHWQLLLPWWFVGSSVRPIGEMLAKWKPWLVTARPMVQLLSVLIPVIRYLFNLCCSMAQWELNQLRPIAKVNLNQHWIRRLYPSCRINRAEK